MKLYLAVTPDKYELPIYVAKNLKEMSKAIGLSEADIASRISQKCSGKRAEVRFLRIEVEE